MRIGAYSVAIAALHMQCTPCSAAQWALGWLGCSLTPLYRPPISMFGILQRQVTRNRHKTELYLQRLNGTDRMPYLSNSFSMISKRPYTHISIFRTCHYSSFPCRNGTRWRVAMDYYAIYRMVSFQVTSQSHDIVQRQITKKMFRDTGMVVTMAV